MLIEDIDRDIKFPQNLFVVYKADDFTRFHFLIKLLVVVGGINGLQILLQKSFVVYKYHFSIRKAWKNFPHC